MSRVKLTCYLVLIERKKNWKILMISFLVLCGRVVLFNLFLCAASRGTLSFARGEQPCVTLSHDTRERRKSNFPGSQHACHSGKIMHSGKIHTVTKVSMSIIFELTACSEKRGKNNLLVNQCCNKKEERCADPWSWAISGKENVLFLGLVPCGRNGQPTKMSSALQLCSAYLGLLIRPKQHHEICGLRLHFGFSLDFPTARNIFFFGYISARNKYLQVHVAVATGEQQLPWKAETTDVASVSSACPTPYYSTKHHGFCNCNVLAQARKVDLYNYTTSIGPVHACVCIYI